MDVLKLIRLKSVATIALVLTLTACANAPERGSQAISIAIVEKHKLSQKIWAYPSENTLLDADLAAPLSVKLTVDLALQHNPRMRMLYAELGLAQAELIDATRISNPSFDWNRLKPNQGNLPAKLSFGLSQSVTDLLMLGARRNFAAGVRTRTQQEISAAVGALIFDAESAYWNCAASEQVRSMRQLVAESAKTSSALAERFFAAGNINKVQLANENAAAAEAQVALKHAEAEALAARAALSQTFGLVATDARVKCGAVLPDLPSKVDSADSLFALAAIQRSDLAAARSHATLLNEMLNSTKRWRWLGNLDFSAERERETDGEKLRGIGFSLGLPIFNQGQASVLRAQAMLETAVATRDQLAVKVKSDVALGVLNLQNQFEIVQTYAKILVPARESAVAEMQKRYNFMLIGAFELMQAKQAEYDAYQSYIDAVRGYWLAHSALKVAVGGELPSSSSPPVDEHKTQAKPAPGPHVHGTMQSTPDPLEIVPAANAAYVCPMHADVTSDKPGQCPICGMELVPKASQKKSDTEKSDSSQPNQHEHNSGAAR